MEDIKSILRKSANPARDLRAFPTTQIAAAAREIARTHLSEEGADRALRGLTGPRANLIACAWGIASPTHPARRR
jgi:hypothetical protein